MSPIFQPIEDSTMDGLNLNDLVVPNPTSTFFMSVSGNTLEEYFIFDKDVLVIDRSLDVRSGKLLVAVCDGDFKVLPFNKNESESFDVWGVVTFVIHKL